ncbi:hypothetical protein D3C78_1148390 [compost metagenome]
MYVFEETGVALIVKSIRCSEPLLILTKASFSTAGFILRRSIDLIPPVTVNVDRLGSMGNLNSALSTPEPIRKAWASTVINGR